MLPSSTTTIDDLILENKQENTQTFRLDTVYNTIAGKIDDLDALLQSIYIMLNIEADQYIIYPYTYGVNTLDLIGKPRHYVMAVLPERLKKTLLSDDRITDVTDFEFFTLTNELGATIKNKLGVKFIVHTIYGNVNNEMEVTY